MPESIVIEITPALRDALDAAAREAGVPVELFARRAIEAELESQRTQAFFARMRKEADLEWFDRFLKREGGEPPRPGDEIE